MRTGSLVTDAKGRFAETILSTILEYAGYRVLRLGVEELISEVKAGVARGESTLQLPEQLRKAPDFLVVDPDNGSCTLLEVKFRRVLDDGVAKELHTKLALQVSFWPGMATAIVCARVPEPGNATNADIRAHIRCLRADDLHQLVEPQEEGNSRRESKIDFGPPRPLSRFQRLRTLGAIFERVADADLYRETEDLVAPIRAWG